MQKGSGCSQVVFHHLLNKGQCLVSCSSLLTCLVVGESMVLAERSASPSTRSPSSSRHSSPVSVSSPSRLSHTPSLPSRSISPSLRVPSLSPYASALTTSPTFTFSLSRSPSVQSSPTKPGPHLPLPLGDLPRISLTPVTSLAGDAACPMELDVVNDVENRREISTRSPLDEVIISLPLKGM